MIWLLTLAWPWSQPNSTDWRERLTPPPPPANFQINDRSETDEAAFEMSRRDGSKLTNVDKQVGRYVSGIVPDQESNGVGNTYIFSCDP